MSSGISPASSRARNAARDTIASSARRQSVSDSRDSEIWTR
jgi:hypothetical protein